MLLLDVPDEKLLTLANEIPEPKTNHISNANAAETNFKHLKKTDEAIDITEDLQNPEAEFIINCTEKRNSAVVTVKQID